jgi:hypothetical protein
MKEASGVGEQLALLAVMPRADLAERWIAAFGCPVPHYAHATLLRRTLAWHLQMQALQRSLGSREFQRLSQTVRRPARRKSAALAPGTRLLRQWQGRTHHVTVAPSGFEYEGATYRSLSAIARRITGGSWSGPLFFGLRS